MAKIHGIGDEKQMAMPMSVVVTGKFVRVLEFAVEALDEKCNFTMQPLVRMSGSAELPITENYRGRYGDSRQHRKLYSVPYKRTDLESCRGHRAATVQFHLPELAAMLISPMSALERSDGTDTARPDMRRISEMADGARGAMVK